MEAAEPSGACFHFELPRRGLDLESGHRIDGGATDPHLEVEMRPRRVPARPHPADTPAGLDVLTNADTDP